MNRYSLDTGATGRSAGYFSIFTMVDTFLSRSMIVVVIVKLLSLPDTDAAENNLMDYFLDDQPQ